MLMSYQGLQDTIDRTYLASEMINHFAFKGDYESWKRWVTRYHDYRFQLLQYEHMFTKYAFNDNESIAEYAQSVIILIDQTIKDCERKG